MVLFPGLGFICTPPASLLHKESNLQKKTPNTINITDFKLLFMKEHVNNGENVTYLLTAVK